MTQIAADTEPARAVAAEAREGKRVLYLTHRVPHPPDKGDRIRNFHLLRQLARRGRVWLACLADEPVSDETRRVLASLCDGVAVVPVSPRRRWLRAGASLLGGRSLSEGAFWEPELHRVIRAWAAAAPFDAAVASASSLAPYLRGPEWASTPAFVDAMDVDSQKWGDFADASRGPPRWLYRWEGNRVRLLERDLPRWAEAVSLVSPAEAAVFERIAGTGTATVALNGVDLDYFRPRPVTVKAACAFVGALDYLPNVDAAVWFVREVWPRVRARSPAAEFWMVGRRPTIAVQRLTGATGVKLIGQVPDVRPYLAEAAVAVVPLRLARGLQNKVLEALAMAKATVASPAALAALRVVPGRDLLSASGPEGWADAVSSLLEDPARRESLGAAGRLFVEENHDWERCLKPLVDRIFMSNGAPLRSG